MASHPREDPENEVKRARAVRKTSMYLSSEASKILEDLAKEGCTSQTGIVNAAIAFYAERGSHMEALIKESVREALQEIQEVNQMAVSEHSLPPPILPGACWGILTAVEPAWDGLIRVEVSHMEYLVSESLLTQLSGLVGQKVVIGQVKGLWRAGVPST